MGTLKKIADDFASEKVNGLNMSLAVAAAVVACFGTADGLLDDYDDGTEMSHQAVASLTQEMDTVSDLSQVDDIQKQRDILTTERKLDELKNGKWAELSDEDVAFMRAQKQFDVDATIAATEFKQALTPVFQNLTLNTDISEAAYANLQDAFTDIAEENNVEIFLSSQARSLKECQLDVGTDAPSSASFKNVQSCMEDGIDGEDAFFLSVFAFMGTFLVIGGFGGPALGAGLNRLDRSLDKRNARIKKTKAAPN